MSTEKNSIHDAVLTIVAEQLAKPKSEIDENALLDSLGMDSLDRVEVVMKCEEEFGVEMNDERVDAICTVRELIAYIEELKQ